MVNNLKDFVGWLRQDKEGEAILSDWRPTDLRFGEIVWQANAGRINFTIGEEQPFIPNYIQPFVPQLPNPGIRKNPLFLKMLKSWPWQLRGDWSRINTQY